MKTELTIEGIKCEGCINRIKTILSTIKGINKFDLSLSTKKLSLDVKKAKTIDEIIKKIEKAGFIVLKNEKS